MKKVEYLHFFTNSFFVLGCVKKTNDKPKEDAQTTATGVKTKESSYIDSSSIDDFR